ncbi:hypothetical protein [Flavobacterium ovatum]|uniref:hypothetical protein n=1 Tax=Flavobacterium ovatum TaxID=1928857 RepID=UPI00344D5864
MLHSIDGAIFSDARSSILYLNDFKFTEIERFYAITNSDKNRIRGWQDYKLDFTNFYCVSGSFNIGYVNATVALEKDSKLISFLTLTLQSSKRR